MQIYNIRLGFATNSSSTHSIVYADNAQDSFSTDFGWDFFTASEPSSKASYLASTLYQNMRKYVSASIAEAVVRDWTGNTIEQGEYGSHKGYIDHQSLLTLPQEYSCEGISKEFYTDLSDYIMKRGVVILGGNDNSDESHPLDSGEHLLSSITREGDSKSLVCRKDSRGYWALFNRNSGTKVRFSFDDSMLIPDKSDTPELVDMKITDFCSKRPMPIPEFDYKGNIKKDKEGVVVFLKDKEGKPTLTLGGGGECAYCYQGSSPKGNHAPFQRVSSLLYSLAAAEVFEVAFGGGEPTQHPDFHNIITTAKGYGIVPNFTTRSLEWLSAPWAKGVLDTCGGFAYSVNTATQVVKFKKAMTKVYYPNTLGKRLYVHYVLGTSTRAEFKKILEACSTNYITLILLGYKTTGRGGEWEPHNHDTWLDDIVEYHKEKPYFRIGIDTAIAQQYGRTIELKGISNVLYHAQEGKYSCYMDAVDMKMSPSSYADRAEFSPLNQHGDDWLKTYANY